MAEHPAMILGIQYLEDAGLLEALGRYALRAMTLTPFTSTSRN